MWRSKTVKERKTIQNAVSYREGYSYRFRGHSYERPVGDCVEPRELGG